MLAPAAGDGMLALQECGAAETYIPLAQVRRVSGALVVICLQTPVVRLLSFRAMTDALSYMRASLWPRREALSE